MTKVKYHVWVGRMPNPIVLIPEEIGYPNAYPTLKVSEETRRRMQVADIGRNGFFYKDPVGGIDGRDPVLTYISPHTINAIEIVVES